MVDTVTPAVRSRIMANVKSKDTHPELRVRRMLHGLGYRYRLHRRDLPGRPDLTFVSRKKVVFVNGCFWHRHSGCPRATIPATNAEFWATKLERNRKRDERNRALLRKDGWSVMTVWECQLRQPSIVKERLVAFLGERSPNSLP